MSPVIGHDSLILIVDDHEVVREGIRALIEQHGAVRIIEASDTEAAYKIYIAERPDIVITDLSLPGGSGLELIHRISARDDQTKIIVLTMHGDPAYARRALKMGASAYVAKEATARELVTAIAEVRKGSVYIDSKTALNMVKISLGRGESKLDDLSPREFEIFGLLAKGMSAKDISALLNLSPNTVSNYRRAIMHKLEISTMAELVHEAIRHRVIAAEPPV